MGGERAEENPNIPKELWLEKRQGCWRNIRGRGTIECGMSSGQNNTIPGHVPAQRTQLKSLRRLGQLSRTEKRRISIFCRLLGHLPLRHPRERG